VFDWWAWAQQGKSNALPFVKPFAKEQASKIMMSGWPFTG